MAKDYSRCTLSFLVSAGEKIDLATENKLQESLTGFSTHLSHSIFRRTVAFKMESRERDCCIAVSRESGEAQKVSGTVSMKMDLIGS